MKQQSAWDKLLDKETTYVVFGGGAGTGKSWLICEWLLTQVYFYPGSRWFIARKELKRLMGSTYITFLKVCKHHSIPRVDYKLNGQYNYIEFTNGSRIDLLDVNEVPSDPMFERFGSLEYTGGAIEEAGEVAFGSFDILKTRIGRHNNFGDKVVMPKLLITCNPSKNWLYKEIYRPNKDKTLTNDYAFIQATYKDNPYTYEEYGKQLASIKDLSQKERLMFGNWEYDDDPARLIDYDSILDMFTNTIEDSEELYLIVDVARFGNDRTVFSLWRGLECEKIWEKTKQGINVTCSDIKQTAQDNHIPYSHILVDEDGLGGGVVDSLQGIKGFVANRSALENKNDERPNYKSLKTQCAYTLAEYINTHQIAVKECSESVKISLIEELEQIKGKNIDKDGKLEIVSKDEVKAHLGRSPDISDVFLMRMFFELNTEVESSTVHIYRPPTRRHY